MTTYATTAQLKEVLGITDISQDTYLAKLLDRASAFVELYTGRSWSTTATTYTDELYERQGRVLWLKNIGVSAITSIKVRDHLSDALVTLDASTYQWTSAGRVELAISYTYVQVTYTTPIVSIPLDIEAATLDIATDAYRSGGENGSVKSERVGDLAISYGTNSATTDGSAAMKVLDLYRVRTI